MFLTVEFGLVPYERLCQGSVTGVTRETSDMVLVPSYHSGRFLCLSIAHDLFLASKAGRDEKIFVASFAERLIVVGEIPNSCHATSTLGNIRNCC